MNKDLIRLAIIQALESQLALAIKAANEARDLATHEQSQPETQYDTVGLEASYLAHGQSQRVLEIQDTLQTYRKLTLTAFSEDDEIRLTALVTLLYPSGEERRLFLGPSAGGVEFTLDNKAVQVVTPDAPISQQMIGLYVGDELTLPGNNTHAEIISIL